MFLSQFYSFDILFLLPDNLYTNWEEILQNHQFDNQIFLKYNHKKRHPERLSYSIPLRVTYIQFHMHNTVVAVWQNRNFQHTH